MKYQWEPTDTEGYCLQRANCGIYISAWEKSRKNGRRLYRPYPEQFSRHLKETNRYA